MGTFFSKLAIKTLKQTQKTNMFKVNNKDSRKTLVSHYVLAFLFLTFKKQVLGRLFYVIHSES